MNKQRVAGILTTGNEVLSGKTLDTNSHFIGGCLTKIGISVSIVMSCGDHEQDLLECLEYMATRCDEIFMTGGLGPTVDDMTAQVISKFSNQPLIFNEQAWENCLESYKKFGRKDIPQSNKKQAYLPEHSKIIPNPVGTAVGFVVEVAHPKLQKTTNIYCLPGVPFESQVMFQNYVLPLLFDKYTKPLMFSWRIFALGESAIQCAMQCAENELKENIPEIHISYQAHYGYITYTVSVFCSDDQKQFAYKTYLENIFSDKVIKTFKENLIYHIGLSLNETIKSVFEQFELSLFVIEGSCGGTLSKELNSVSSSNTVYKSGLILGENYPLSDCYLKAVQNDFGAADICILETGAPSASSANKHFEHGSFKLAISILKSRLKKDTEICLLTPEFGWSLIAKAEDHERLYIEKFYKVSSRYPTHIQQNFVASHLMCTLLILEKYLC